MSAADKAETVKNCGTCDHWHCPLKDKGVGLGQCREGPPISSFNWPRTREADSCGKWRPISDARAGAQSPQAGATAGDHDAGNSAGPKSEVLASHTGPEFARSKSVPRGRR